MLTLNIFRSKEIRAALAALEELRGMFADNLVFDELHRDLRSNIVDNGAAIRDQMKRGRSPRDICLLALVKLAADDIASGGHHTYRGVLALTGQQRLAVWERGMNDLVARGLLPPQVRADRRRELQELIKEAG